MAISRMIDTDDIFEALSSSRRRAVVALLEDHRDGMELRDLADEIGLHEVREDAGDGQKKNAQQAVYVSLYQSHVPTLEDYRIVTMHQHGVGQGGWYVRPDHEFDRAVRTLQAAEGDGGSLTDRLREML